MNKRPDVDVPLPSVEIRSDAPMDGCFWVGVVAFWLALLAFVAVLGFTFAQRLL